jgi:Kef-type K+ transport system membrane component KefB
MNTWFTLPQLPLTDPIPIFLLVLLIILSAPLLNKVKIPHIIGLILAGMLLGPFGLNVLANDKSFELFGKVGILYIMFLAGLEIDLNTFKKNRSKGLVFGILTFLIPMILGILSGFYILKFDWITSTLLASMYASHTLIAYPIVSKMGISKHRAISITVAGTILF